ncbi:prephenate dehydrogenase [NADP+] [Kluyveromyces marxianus]|mgnify:CR=1 FL=1|uniref:Prephenate dehydrogenase [NADP(+)] n=2 Tax=Kluyveromyces marxianus TaxID=4911 RepID=W0T6M2_KLUMD|nr:prephenate dehydrogenase [NADP+] [Kluyveromyces marxianus DMKU3-1042]QGN13385.1 prephenate dehydrogenase [Kluyveromyces marxianus]BAO38441.1 prephenate dehydrogenase [NADP+] [Kluyveromyces marxianus DMKU3-1042]BAP69994.1 prephenate dehydrogenase [NADP+] [Kluyveromyces marxianus]
MIATEEQISRWKEEKIIGIIGLGDMGLLYANRFSNAGWKVVCCDREDYYDDLKVKYAGERFTVLKNGTLVSRCSDYIIYSVEAENIGAIVKLYAGSTKVGAIVGGQTSCKNAEIKAFEEYLPPDCEIISVHSLHGPKVNTEGQPLVLINHRTKSQESFDFVESLMSCLKSKHVYLSYEEHDRITADTQAVTHAAFLSMGVAWYQKQIYPWSLGVNKWQGSLENVKVNISLRIYSNKWHVYAGLAITNPAAHKQITQYAKSATELFTLFVEGKKDELTERLSVAKQFVFGNHNGKLLLHDLALDGYSLSKHKKGVDDEIIPNSHLSLLAIVDSWYQLGIDPYDHMICSTPLFRIFLGVSEYLFLSEGLLEQTIEAAINVTEFRADDMEFVIAARSWSNIVSFGNFDLYKRQFEEVQRFFTPMFPEANAIGNEMIKTILQHSKD